MDPTLMPRDASLSDSRIADVRFLFFDATVGFISCKVRHLKWSAFLFVVYRVHTEKYFQNLIRSNRNEIVFTIFRLIWNTNGHVRLDPNHLKDGKYNLIWG